ncbi:tRNA pseudouridine(38-40) synthase TruA [Litoribacter alkaliphilus]|uniref:tRNA pseudouridine synthase A n=1 Tax=Litoribacter ruber TaxID=702568 RepID=A0AAP2G0D6_9BACT|nr:tRNA pseudouridine(38-40) synthase TruA [Litoribacter alkaliphilus]MBS9522604.1 tRNA pseudouridine(38-40) synthase TruA [Litoribacter alkaliphilus]
MQRRSHTYLCWIQYLGYRYHGWQMQQGVKTIQGQLERTIAKTIGHDDFSILPAGRTDAGVSCQKGAFELFLTEPAQEQQLLQNLNDYLPLDIRILDIQPVPLSFNVIQDVAYKEYRYYFSFGNKPHPFNAAHIVNFEGQLDVELMGKAASLFKGEHDFRRFCVRKKVDNYRRLIMESGICRMEEPMGYFAPEQVYYYKVKGTGFLTHQIRQMMGALVEVGMGKLGLEDVEEALKSELINPLSFSVPAQGLVMHEVVFK